MFMSQADGLAGGSGCQHDVPQPFQHPRGHFQDCRFVFHQEDGLVVAFGAGNSGDFSATLVDFTAYFYR
jgi:hypothetical protein